MQTASERMMAMIQVKVVLYASLSRYHPNQGGAAPFIVSMDENSTITQLLGKLGIPEKEIKQFFVKNRRQDGSYILEDGDRVAIFPPVGGG